MVVILDVEISVVVKVVEIVVIRIAWIVGVVIVTFINEYHS